MTLLIPLGGILQQQGAAEADPPDFRSVATAQIDNSETITIGKPAGTVQNDVMICLIGTSSVTATQPTLAGWTEVGSGLSGSSMSGASWCYYRVAGASEGSDYTFDGLRSTDDSSGFIASLTGIDTSTPFDAFGASQGGSPNTTSVTTVVNNAYIVGLTHSDSSGAQSYSSSSFDAERLDFRFTNKDHIMAMYTEDDAGAAGLKNRTVAFTGGGAGLWVVSFQPAS